MTNMFLHFEGDDMNDIGESNVKGKTKRIEILGFSHSFHQPTSATRSTSGGGTVERANHADLTFQKYLDASIDNILGACWRGKHIDKATIECYRSDGADSEDPVKYLTIIMEFVIISNYSISAGAGDIPIENVSLTYGKIKYEYKSQDEKKGTLESANHAITHDLITNTVS